MVCRPPYLPFRTVWLFCRYPWTSGVAPRATFATCYVATFFLGLSSSFFPFSNCLNILPGSFYLTCCPTCFSYLSRPSSLPSRTARLFCRDPWTSRLTPRVSPTFLRGLSSSFSPFLNCLAILPGSLDLTCCPTCFSKYFSYLSPWSVVLLVSFLELPGNFARILGPHVYLLCPKVVSFLLLLLQLAKLFLINKIRFLKGLTSKIFLINKTVFKGTDRQD